MEEDKKLKRQKITTPFPLNDGIIFHSLSNPNQVIINEGAGFNLSGSNLVISEEAVGYGKILQFLGFGTIHVGHMGDGTSEPTCIWKRTKSDGDLTDYALLTFRHEKNLGNPKDVNVLTCVRKHKMLNSMTIEQSTKCGMCYQRLEVGRDVSTLITKEGKPFCQAINKNGWFKVCHTSCLLHWLLFRVSKNTRPCCPVCIGDGLNDDTGLSKQQIQEGQIEMFRANQEWTRGSNGPTGSNVPVSKTGLKFPFTEGIIELQKSLPFYIAN